MSQGEGIPRAKAMGTPATSSSGRGFYFAAPPSGCTPTTLLSVVEAPNSEAYMYWDFTSS